MAEEKKYDEEGNKVTVQLDDATASTFDPVAMALRDAREHSKKADLEKEKARIEAMVFFDHAFDSEDFERTRIIEGKSFRLMLTKGIPSSTTVTITDETFWSRLKELVPEDRHQELMDIRNSFTKEKEKPMQKGRITKIELIGGEELIDPDN